MQYLLLIYDNEQRWSNRGTLSQTYDLEEWGAFGKEFAGSIVGGHALQPTPSAKTVRVRAGNLLVTDGPFAETKEQLAGYYLVEAGSIDEAVAVAAKMPWARYGSIEARPIQKFS